MGGEEIGDDKSEVIVDGYRFTVDRTVPKVVEELGAADGVVISASISGNNGWFKAGEATNVSVTGIIKTYSGGTITTYSATKGGEPIADFSINSEGRYTINNITTNTTIEIKAKDSNNKENSKTVPITIKVDGTAPTVETVIAEANEMDITISAIGHDKNASGQEESGIAKFHYTITPTDGVSSTNGDFGINEKPRITTTVETTYTIKVTATDKVGNGPSVEKTTTVTVEIPFGEKETVKKTATDGEWWIPKGFEEASDSSSTIQGGKVIEDKTGNQWVWIPCYLGEKTTSKGYQQYSQATEYKRTAFCEEDITSEFTETLDGTDEASIKKYGGFYIGRYEAGADTDTSSENNARKVYIKRNKVPYRYISIANSKTKSNNFVNDNNYDTSKVYTKLVSSYAWDTTLSFIAVTNSSYPTNSPQGNYSDHKYGNGLINTGLTTSVCNIYDMGGNLEEYTSESHSYVSNPYVARGGCYGNSASGLPAGYRGDRGGNAGSVFGFRPLLYIK